MFYDAINNKASIYLGSQSSTTEPIFTESSFMIHYVNVKILLYYQVKI